MMTDNPYEPPHADDLRPSRGWRWLGWLAVAAVAGLVMVALGLPMMRPGAQEAARRTVCRMNLRAIAQAMLVYEQEHGTLPPACTRDADGHSVTFFPTGTNECGPECRLSLIRIDDRKIDPVE